MSIWAVAILFFAAQREMRRWSEVQESSKWVVFRRAKCCILLSRLKVKSLRENHKLQEQTAPLKRAVITRPKAHPASWSILLWRTIMGPSFAYWTSSCTEEKSHWLFHQGTSFKCDVRTLSSAFWYNEWNSTYLCCHKFTQQRVFLDPINHRQNCVDIHDMWLCASMRCCRFHCLQQRISWS